jgi:hypothetical protein
LKELNQYCRSWRQPKLNYEVEYSESVALQKIKEIEAICCIRAQAEAQHMPHNHLIIFNLVIRVNTIYNNYNLEYYHHEYYHDWHGGTCTVQSWRCWRLHGPVWSQSRWQSLCVGQGQKISNNVEVLTIGRAFREDTMIAVFATGDLSSPLYMNHHCTEMSNINRNAGSWSITMSPSSWKLLTQHQYRIVTPYILVDT